MNVLDLFSGIGGFSLGLERAGMRTVAFCECDPYCQAVLRKHWPDVPVFGDVRTLTAEALANANCAEWRSVDQACGSTEWIHGISSGKEGSGRSKPGRSIDVICGGFPCQDISVAGKGAGIDGARSGLWSEYARIISEVRPRYVIVENVAALLGRGLSRVLGDLATLGYDAEWHCIPASAVGAPHRRDRVWIIATNGDTNGSRSQVPQTADDRQAFLSPTSLERPDWWLSEPDVGRVANGVSARVDRLRALGNAVVPQIPEIIGRAIMEANQSKCDTISG